ncbi:MAG: DEAD/DEAH box helicase [Nanoarchaeota archaeon]|nr:DEAD/DEAH box helicase [Nanoarchaeota archaeon]
MDFLENITPREYQKNIFETCIKKNCLVVLPTGVGKTLIALMVAIERMKQFPGEKVVILAPTKPLAEQHLESFKKNLPELFGDMQLFTGSVNADKRKKIWQTADILFSTPQCIANDVKKRLYNLSDVCLLVEDEAHRCVKNYSYNLVAKKYLEQAQNPRIIGLTASPGSDKQKIKDICKNLSIEEVELRTRESPDVKKYLQKLEFERIEVELPKEFQEIGSLLKKIYTDYTDKLRSSGLLTGYDSKIALIELQGKLMRKLKMNLKHLIVYQGISNCAQAIKISHAFELLETQTMGGLHKYLKSLYNQAAKKQSKGVITLVSRPEFTRAFSLANEQIIKKQEHPKIEKLIEIIKTEDLGKKRIIFSQFRDTAKIISDNLNKIPGIKSKVFVGQTKKSETGLSQKEQKKIIDEFREKKINILCATSIGEEGLDIPEVDSVIFYEPVSSAIRSIQRRGRTARLQKGELKILITKDTKDQRAYYASRSREKKMQKSIESIKEELKLNGKLKPNEFQKKLI